jgi:hypothetical protein
VIAVETAETVGVNNTLEVVADPKANTTTQSRDYQFWYPGKNFNKSLNFHTIDHLCLSGSFNRVSQDDSEALAFKSNAWNPGGKEGGDGKKRVENLMTLSLK